MIGGGKGKGKEDKMDKGKKERWKEGMKEKWEKKRKEGKMGVRRSCFVTLYLCFFVTVYSLRVTDHPLVVDDVRSAKSVCYFLIINFLSCTTIKLNSPLQQFNIFTIHQLNNSKSYHR